LIDPAPTVVRRLIISPDNARGSSAGFTLLELMVAIAVLAIALVALLSSQSRTMFVADINDFASTSAQLGTRQLTEILSREMNASPRAANFDAPHTGYFWEVELGVPPLDQDILSVEVVDYLQRIDLVVGDERRNRSITITRYRFSAEPR
jgi:general secretion pathway protein I